MSDPFQNILQSGNQELNPFPVTSRYYTTARLTYHPDTERPVAYLLRRFVPPAESLELISEYTVKEEDRLDNISARQIGDPEQFWQIADANNAIKPEELTDEPGTVLRITHPAGMRTF